MVSEYGLEEVKQLTDRWAWKQKDLQESPPETSGMDQEKMQGYVPGYEPRYIVDLLERMIGVPYYCI